MGVALGVGCDSVENDRKELEVTSERRRILLETAALPGVAVISYLLLEHALLPRSFAAHPDLIACAFFLLWTWPVYRLVSRYRVLPSVPKNQNESELQMLRTVIDSLPDLIYFKDIQSRFDS